MCDEALHLSMFIYLLTYTLTYAVVTCEIFETILKLFQFSISYVTMSETEIKLF